MGMPDLPLGAGIDSTRHDDGLSRVNLDKVSPRLSLLSSTNRFQVSRQSIAAPCEMTVI